MGSICVAHHRWSDAVRAYEAAVDAGGELYDLSRLGKMYNDLSIAHRRLDRLGQARQYAQRAVHLHELLNDRLSVARAETNLALVLVRLGRTAEAGVMLGRALAIFETEGVERGRAHILLALANVGLQREDRAGAWRYAKDAHELAERLGERTTLAEACEVLARIASGGGDDREADRRFREALAILEDLGLHSRLMACHAAYAAELERRGDDRGALEHWKRAVGSVHPELVAREGEALPTHSAHLLA
jgi:tetratricopeptide (TPR) repeat protein